MKINCSVVIIVHMDLIKSSFWKNTYLTVKYTVHSEPKCQPRKTNGLNFCDVSKQHKVLYVIYADFKSILETHDDCQTDPSKSSTIKLAKHVPSGFNNNVVGLSINTTMNHVTYRGHDAVDKFIDHLIKLEDELLRVLRQSKPMDLSKEENQAFMEATKWHICNNKNWRKMPFLIIVT